MLNSSFDSIIAVTNTSSSIVVVLSVVTIAVFYGIFYRNSKGSPPPGPSRSPFRKSSGLQPYQVFSALQKRYGPIFSFYQGRTPVIVLGKMKQAVDLLEKRGSIYSSRPRNIMAGEILSGNMRGLDMPYGPRWRKWRSLMQVGMNIETSQTYKVLQTIESSILLRDLLEERDQSKYAHHFRRFSASIAVYVGHGRRIKELDDPVFVAQQQVEEYYIGLRTPGKYIVESWPILLYLPRALQWFRREPEAQRIRDTDLYMSLLNNARRKVEAGTIQPCIARHALEKQALFGLTDVELAYALSAPLNAGIGPTVAVLDVFFLAMLHYPDVMRKAQADIDDVVGSRRLPDFNDMEALPYLTAIINETLRWRPVASLGAPHCTSAEDTYEGMYIPKGSTVFANITAISKDEEWFPSPEDFNPDRYLQRGESEKMDQSHRSTFFFGFGRRICTGMHIAHNSFFIIISRLLWAFDIMPELDASGNPVLPSKDDSIGSLVIRPRPFVYELRFRRSGEGKALILSESEKAQEMALAWV